MNVLNAIGNINNPELRFLSDQTPVLQFSFALNSGYGEKAVTTWLNCSLFGKRAQTLSTMLNKGDKIGVTGELTNRPYTDKSGNQKHSLELRVSDLTLLGSKGDSNTQAKQNNAPKAQETQNNDAFDDFVDEPLPF